METIQEPSQSISETSQPSSIQNLSRPAERNTQKGKGAVQRKPPTIEQLTAASLVFASITRQAPTGSVLVEGWKLREINGRMRPFLPKGMPLDSAFLYQAALVLGADISESSEPQGVVFTFAQPSIT